MEKLKSRKLWVLIGTIIIALVNGYWELNIDPEIIWTVVGLAGVYLVGQSAADLGKELSNKTVRNETILPNIPTPEQLEEFQEQAGRIAAKQDEITAGLPKG